MDDINDFLDDFKNASSKITGTKKLLSKGLVAILGVTALSGCQMTAEQSLYDIETTNAPNKIEKTIDSELSIGQRATPIDENNIKDIVLNQKSGVYQHPFYPDQIKTFYFKEDPKADERIQADLKELGITDAGYMWQQMRMSMAKKYHNLSFHIQEPLGIGTDVNLSFIDAKGYKSPISGMQTFLRGVDLLFHEAAHSLEHQQPNTMDFFKSVFTSYAKEKSIGNESGANFIGSLETLKMVKKLNINEEEFKKHLEFKKRSNIKTNKDVRADIKGEYSMDPHQDIPISMIFIHMYENNKSDLLNLSKEEVNELTAKLTDVVLEHDYMKDYTLDLENRDLGLMRMLMVKASEAKIKDPEAYKITYNSVKESYESGTASSTTFTNAKEFLRMMDAINGQEEEILKNRNNEDYLNAKIKEVTKKSELQDAVDIRIDDWDSNKVFSKMSSMQNLISKVIKMDLFKKNKIDDSKKELLSELENASEPDKAKILTAKSKNKNKNTI